MCVCVCGHLVFGSEEQMNETDLLQEISTRPLLPPNEHLRNSNVSWQVGSRLPVCWNNA